MKKKVTKKPVKKVTKKPGLTYKKISQKLHRKIKANIKKEVKEIAHRNTAYEACLIYSRKLRAALEAIVALEPGAGIGMTTEQGPNLTVAQEIAKEALEQ